jgi:hypothetical protein
MVLAYPPEPKRRLTEWSIAPQEGIISINQSGIFLANTMGGYVMGKKDAFDWINNMLDDACEREQGNPGMALTRFKYSLIKAMYWE